MSSLDTFKKRMLATSRLSLRDEVINNSKRLLQSTFLDDASANPNIVYWNTTNKLKCRITDRKKSSSYGVSAKVQVFLDEVLTIGDIVYDNVAKEYWICVEMYNIDDVYKQGLLGLCNYTLTWQSPNGTILSYPCIDTTTSTMGLNESNTLTTPNSIHTIKLPFDEHTLLINTDDRFFIDDLSVEVPQVFAVSKPNRTEFRYGNKGLIELTMKQSSFKNDGTDRKDLGVCDYFTPTPPQPSTTCEITYTGQQSPVVYIGGKSKTFTAKFFDVQGVEISTPVAVWSHNIPLVNQAKIIFVSNGSTCTLQVKNDKSLINTIIRLSLTDTTGVYNTFVDIKIVSATG